MKRIGKSQKKKRSINYKHLGWLVSTIIFYGTAYPFIGYLFYRTIIQESGPIMIDPKIWIGVLLIMKYYVHRNYFVGYGLTHWKNYWKAQEEKKYKMYRQKRHEEWLNSPQKRRFDIIMSQIEKEETEERIAK